MVRLLRRSAKVPPKWQGENNVRDRRLRLRRSFHLRPRRHLRGGLPDGQQGHHELPGVVIERAEELRDKEAAEGMSGF